MLRLHKECPSQLSLPMPPGIPPSTPFEHNYADCVGQQCLVIDCPDRVKYSKPLKVRRKQNRTVSLAASGTTSLDWVPDKLSSDGGANSSPRWQPILHPKPTWPSPQIRLGTCVSNCGDFSPRVSFGCLVSCVCLHWPLLKIWWSRVLGGAFLCKDPGAEGVSVWVDEI